MQVHVDSSLEAANNVSLFNVSEPREELNRSSKLRFCSCRIWETMLSKICITGH